MDNLVIPLTGGTGLVVAVIGWYGRLRFHEWKKMKTEETERKAAEVAALSTEIKTHVKECNLRREHSAALEQKVSGIDERLCAMGDTLTTVHSKVDTIGGQLGVLIARGK